MQIETTTAGAATVLTLTGRLDVTWAEHVLSRAQEIIRGGQHHLRVDAAGLDYLSSAGIRILIRIRRELSAVNGSFGVVNASPFVENTLRMSGLGALLDAPDVGGASSTGSALQQSTRLEASATPTVAGASCAGSRIDAYPIAPGATMQLHAPATWNPWRPVQDADIVKVAFPEQTVGLGIGAQGVDAADSRQRLGEFVAVPGGVIWLPSDGNRTPDYMLQAERFVPDIFAVQALIATGTFSHLIRFQPREKGDVAPLAELIGQALLVTQSDAVVMVCVAEIDGLVGAGLARSPGLISDSDTPGQFPDARDWMVFCGERVHARQSAVLVSFASRQSVSEQPPLLAPLPSLPGVSAHTHAAVLPFRPLQAGVVDLAPTVRLLLESAEPLDLLHLVEDARPAIGLGQSAFIRGACWCSPLSFGKECRA